MANQEQLEILKQGYKDWNKWRKKNPNAEVDLLGAKLDHADLRGARLENAKLSGAILNGANLRGVNLEDANLFGAVLKEADLKNAYLGKSDLRESDLSKADLSKTNLRRANLRKANLSQANLNEANLKETNLSYANLREANLSQAELEMAKFTNTLLGRTNFGFNDLSQTIDLEKADHLGPSIMPRETLIISKGKIPEVFLRGCGLSDWEIESAKLYSPDLSNEEINGILYRMYDLRAGKALQISSLFISYSHADGTFVDKLEKYLDKLGIRFWRDIHDAKAGRLEKQISRAIRLNPTVLLILSESSIKSDWVEHEVRTARELEKEMGRDVLCPVALDDSWKNSPWSKVIMEQVMKYNILDFAAWKDESKFGNIFNKLIDGLELFYK